MSVLNGMSWREFLYWHEYLRIEPLDDGDNKRTALLLAQITNMAGRVLPGRKMVKPADFLSGLGLEVSEQKPQSMEEQITYMKSLGNPDG